MYCACGSGRNGAKVDLPANAHAVPEIPVGSRETDFSFPEHAHVVPEAGAAPGRPYRATRFEDIGKHPVRIAFLRIAAEAGITRVRTATLFPFTSRANRARSEYRPFVQVPTKTWSSGAPARASTGFTVSTR